MVLRAADPHGRSEEGIDALGHRSGQMVAEQRVRCQRHVRAVLLGSAECHHHRIAPPLLLGPHLRPRHAIQLRRSHRVRSLRLEAHNA